MEEKEFIFDSDLSNNKIDIYAEPDVAVKKLKSQDEKELKVSIEGQSVDYSVVNALRRVVMMNIPIYAFHRSNTYIEVEKSKHMYNNDLLYNQIETLPIFDVPNYYDLENPEIFMSTEVMKNLFGKFLPQKYTEDKNTLEEKELADSKKKLIKIEASINFKNNTGSDRFVNTHDIVLKMDGKISNSYTKRRPICFMVLKPDEEISFRTEANLGIAKMHASYEATTLATHERISETKYNLIYETLEQLDKYIIFNKACLIIIKKLEYLKAYILREYPIERSNNEKIEYDLIGEDHTIGNLFSTALQKTVFVEKAAYIMKHPFIDNVTIAYKVKDKSKVGPIKVSVDCLSYLIKLFEKISQVKLD